MDIHARHRRSIRLPGYDYAQPNAYFVTICAWQRRHIFGDINDGNVILSELGKIIHEEWIKTSEIRQEIELDERVIMPNHMHGIVWIRADVGACGARPSPVVMDVHPPNYRSEGARHAPLRQMSKSLGSFIAGFKSIVTKRIHDIDPFFGHVWQRNYYERIIRSERELDAVRRYILENPLKWEIDPENPAYKPK